MRRRFVPLLSAVFALALLVSRAAAGDLAPHAPQPLALPTYDGSGQGVEPDVLWFPHAWGGYAYWMVMTPYTCGDEARENPSILASQDGVTWVAPAAGGETVRSPLVGNPAGCGVLEYGNSDPSLVLGSDSLLVYFVVTHYQGLRAGWCDLVRLASADGIHWTPAADAPVVWSRQGLVLSPSVVRDPDGGYRMWYVAATQCGAAGTIVRVRTSPDGLAWSDADDAPAQMDGTGGTAFHLTVKRVGDVLAMLYVAYPAGADCAQARTLWYAESTDGIAWHARPEPLLSPRGGSGAWDSRGLYRSSFVGRYPNIGIWYSAYGDSQCRVCDRTVAGPVWRVGFTELGDYRSPMVVGGLATVVDLGRTIVGGPSEEHRVEVANLLPLGSADLSYSFTAPAEFEVLPSGAFVLAPGDANSHVLRMNTRFAGRKSASALLESADPAFPGTLLRLRGVVLRHAQPSFDSLSLVVRDTLDLGEHVRGQFPAALLRVHNRGGDSLQARLDVRVTSVLGGDDRFRIEGGPQLVGDAAGAFRVRFDDTGASQDSTYTATLELACADESGPGATRAAPLFVALTAHVRSSVDPRPGPDGTLAVTRLYTPWPNPLADGATVRVDLVRTGALKLELFDAGGRRVATLANGRYERGRYAFAWNRTLDDGSRARAGLYLLRLSGAGIAPTTQRVGVVR